MKINADPDCSECSGTGQVWCGDRHTGMAHPCTPCGSRAALTFLLDRIGSWTSARWDQHVRFEFGDEVADGLAALLQKSGVTPYRGH